MKHGTLAVCCLTVLSAATGCGSSEAGHDAASSKSPYVGTWKGDDPFGQTMILTLEDKGKLALQIGSPRGSFTKRGTYRIDSSKKPAHFNIKLSDREIQTIVKLDDDGHLTFESINSSDRRPSVFGDRKIVLIRQ